MNKNKYKIVFLGYVFLPLASEFAIKYYNVGFDVKLSMANIEKAEMFFKQGLRNTLDKLKEI